MRLGETFMLLGDESCPVSTGTWLLDLFERFGGFASLSTRIVVCDPRA